MVAGLSHEYSARCGVSRIKCRAGLFAMFWFFQVKHALHVSRFKLRVSLIAKLAGFASPHAGFNVGFDMVKHGLSFPV
jgi:hypothetical protein